MTAASAYEDFDDAPVATETAVLSAPLVSEAIMVPEPPGLTTVDFRSEMNRFDAEILEKAKTFPVTIATLPAAYMFVRRIRAWGDGWKAFWKPHLDGALEAKRANEANRVRIVGEIDSKKNSKAAEQLMMERIQVVEDEARREYCFTFKPKGERLIDAGFVEHDDGRFGCSPDALIGETSGLEIKCPKFKTHVKYLLDGELPPDYAVQVHGSMYATGRPSWVFMSYATGFPPFVLTVQRDEAICAKIGEALAGFYKRYDDAMAQLRKAA